MNTKANPTPDTTAAPAVTIAPRNPARGVLLFVVTLTTHQDVRAYPCRSREKALELANRFLAGVTNSVRPPAPAPEPNPHLHNGPPRPAEQVAA